MPFLNIEPAHISVAAGQADAVEVFADGDRVLPGGAQKFAQLGHRERRAVREPLGDTATEVAFGFGAQEEFRRNLDGMLFLAEQGEELGDDGGAGPATPSGRRPRGD